MGRGKVGAVAQGRCRWWHRGLPGTWLLPAGTRLCCWRAVGLGWALRLHHSPAPVQPGCGCRAAPTSGAAGSETGAQLAPHSPDHGSHPGPGAETKWRCQPASLGFVKVMSFQCSARPGWLCSTCCNPISDTSRRQLPQRGRGRRAPLAWLKPGRTRHRAGPGYSAHSSPSWGWDREQGTDTPSVE